MWLQLKQRAGNVCRKQFPDFANPVIYQHVFFFIKPNQNNVIFLWYNKWAAQSVSLKVVVDIDNLWTGIIPSASTSGISPFLKVPLSPSLTCVIYILWHQVSDSYYHIWKNTTRKGLVLIWNSLIPRSCTQPVCVLTWQHQVIIHTCKDIPGSYSTLGTSHVLWWNRLLIQICTS